MSEEPVSARELDDLVRLPIRNRVSIGLLLGLTGLNAFNDNILKMLLVGLAPKVVEGTLGRDIGLWLGGMILVPYIVFAPLAGYLSDRFSKRNVILFMLFAQTLILSVTGFVFHLGMGRTSVLLALSMFFLLAVQSTIFSPAKMGILKELVGSRRLGMVAGGLQMLTMMGILSGLSLGGPWFDRLFSGGKTAWEAASFPVWTLFGVSLVAFGLGWFIQPTRPHVQARFQVSILWEHFANLRETLSHYGLRRACFGVAIYWFAASMAGAMFVDIGLHLHPGADGEGAATEASVMTLMVGLGTIFGSLIVAGVCRRGLQLGIVPFGALGMAAGLFGAGWWSARTLGFDASLVFLGIAGACYMVPIQAYVQDRAEPSRRGRVLASMNLLDSIAGVIAVALLFAFKHVLGVGFIWQFWLLAILMLVATIYIVRLLPQDLIRFVGRAMVRSIYRVRALHADRVPREGGVLMLPNHVSYVDALILSTACYRPVRFVIWDAIYKMTWCNGLLRLFGAVPVSPTRAKDAVRRVVEALRDGEIVCLFPEGQLTRHGMVNELQKGFEIIVRQSGAAVMPVYFDGLWGSVFSYQGGKAFTKQPKKLRYPVMVNFGEVLGTEVATAEGVRSCWQQLAVEAFLSRDAFAQRLAAVSDLKEKEKSVVVANALRLGEVEWLQPGEKLWMGEADESLIARSLRAYAELHHRVRMVEEGESGGENWVGVATLRGWKGWIEGGGDTAQFSRIVVVVERLEELSECDALDHKECAAFPAWMDAPSGCWLTMNVPNPVMPIAQEGKQMGTRANSAGRLLPCLMIQATEDGVRLSGLAPGVEAEVMAKGWKLDVDGFLVLIGGEGSVVRNRQ